MAKALCVCRYALRLFSPSVPLCGDYCRSVTLLPSVLRWLVSHFTQSKAKVLIMVYEVLQGVASHCLADLYSCLCPAPLLPSLPFLATSFFHEHARGIPMPGPLTCSSFCLGSSSLPRLTPWLTSSPAVGLYTCASSWWALPGHLSKSQLPIWL